MYFFSFIVTEIFGSWPSVEKKSCSFSGFITVQPLVSRWSSWIEESVLASSVRSFFERRWRWLHDNPRLWHWWRFFVRQRSFALSSPRALWDISSVFTILRLSDKSENDSLGRALRWLCERLSDGILLIDWHTSSKFSWERCARSHHHKSRCWSSGRLLRSLGRKFIFIKSSFPFIPREVMFGRFLKNTCLCSGERRARDSFSSPICWQDWRREERISSCFGERAANLKLLKVSEWSGGKSEKSETKWSASSISKPLLSRMSVFRLGKLEKRVLMDCGVLCHKNVTQSSRCSMCCPNSENTSMCFSIASWAVYLSARCLRCGSSWKCVLSLRGELFSKYSQRSSINWPICGISWERTPITFESLFLTWLDWLVMFDSCLSQGTENCVVRRGVFMGERLRNRKHDEVFIFHFPDICFIVFLLYVFVNNSNDKFSFSRKERDSFYVCTKAIPLFEKMHERKTKN